MRIWPCHHVSRGSLHCSLNRQRRACWSKRVRPLLKKHEIGSSGYSSWNLCSLPRERNLPIVFRRHLIWLTVRLCLRTSISSSSVYSITDRPNGKLYCASHHQGKKCSLYSDFLSIAIIHMS